MFNIDPVLLQIGSIEIRYYGLVYFFGIILVYFYLKKKKILENEELEKFMLYLVLGMFLGARLIGIISNDPLALIKDPLEFFRVWNGGMSFFGGFFGGLIGSYLVLKNKLLEVGDSFVIPLSFILIFGRLANFINQELIGKITNVSWCVNFSTAIGCRHPYQLYSAFGHLILFLIIYFVSKKSYRRGSVFFTFVLGYGAMRFVLDFFKERTEVFGLSVWQYLSILFIIVGVYYFVKNKYTKLG